MPVTDTSERGLEQIICSAMTGRPCGASSSQEANGAEATTASKSSGWICGHSGDYNREYMIDLAQFGLFVAKTQPNTFDGLHLAVDHPRRRKFLARLQGEVGRRGVIDVLRKGVKFHQYHVELYFGTASPGNPLTAERNAQNRFSVTRQLHYSLDETQRSLDIALFINGLPIATFELKNSLTKQTVSDAIQQYKRDRDPSSAKLFELGRCMAHFAVDDHQVQFCTDLKGKDSWFLPFNRGWDDGAGNPPNPNGLKTDYLWNQILSRQGLTDILENYARLVVIKDAKTGKRRREQIWPRYHQLDVVRKLRDAVLEDGPGKRYLIQHSAGSGKSNSISWLTYQLVGLRKSGVEVFDSVFVVTDRRILDKQINHTIERFAEVRANLGHAEKSLDLRKFIEDGKKIIISTVQKFPFILDEIGDEQRGRHFAVIIDEAHSSQGGKTSAAITRVISETGAKADGETLEDVINRIIEVKQLPCNASYFAFTATPTNKTLEIFGESYPEGGQTKHRPFHTYTMKQAIQEGFILDVLRYYTPVKSYYRLVKRIASDPLFDIRNANKKLRRYVESHEKTIQLKSEIIVDHFQEHSREKIGGRSRAMVVTGSIERAIRYYHSIRRYLLELKSPYEVIVAFSGKHEFGGTQVTEASLNGFSSKQIADRIQREPYRFLVCADKFQTGYDEPLLHTMYVDKHLADTHAVQTLSRLNRAHPHKYDAFVLDFTNDVDTIREAFDSYYRTTLLSDETDPNELHDLQDSLNAYEVYSTATIQNFVILFLGNFDRDRLDPILDSCVAIYKENLDDDERVDFKSKARAFLRTYDFLATILTYPVPEWERLSIFLQFLVPKLPAQIEDDLSKGIIESIDMDNYRVERNATMNLCITDENAEIDPAPVGGGGAFPEAQLDHLSNILRVFNGHFGNMQWTNEDRTRRLATEVIPARMLNDSAYGYACRSSDRQNARIELNEALKRVMPTIIDDDIELYRQYVDNEAFKHLIRNTIFELTYSQSAAKNHPVVP